MKKVLMGVVLIVVAVLAAIAINEVRNAECIDSAYDDMVVEVRELCRNQAGCDFGDLPKETQERLQFEEEAKVVACKKPF
jgi:hypothetical protein